MVILLVPHSTWAWNATGHEVVAQIAWDRMTAVTRQRVVALLEGAPPDACLVDQMPTDGRPLSARQLEFFPAHGVEPGQCCGERVGPGREVGEAVAARRVGHRRTHPFDEHRA